MIDKNDVWAARGGHNTAFGTKLQQQNGYRGTLVSDQTGCTGLREDVKKIYSGSSPRKVALASTG